MIGSKLNVMVIVGEIVDAFLRSDGAHDLGWHAHGHHPGWHMHAGRNDRPGSDHGIIFHNAATKQHGIHTDKHTMANAGTVQHGPVAGGDLLADGLINAGVAMNDDAILDVGAAAKGDAGDIATDDGTEPDAAIFADGDVAADAGVICEPKFTCPAYAVRLSGVHHALSYSVRGQKGKAAWMTREGDSPTMAVRYCGWRWRHNRPTIDGC